MIGNRIKSARQLRKRSQAWLAEEVGVKQSSVSAWETGKSDPATENLSRIAQVLNVNFEWLAKGSGEISGANTPATVVIADQLPSFESYSDEQREFLRLFDALTKSKRETLLTFMKEWIK